MNADRGRARDHRAAALAGVLLIGAGAAILMGIITAEATYPDTYTTFENQISDLGASRPPDSIIREPSATIFNSVMIVTGVMILVASYLLHRAFDTRRVTISVACIGIGVLGVGVFPGNNTTLHPIFALTAFLSGGVAALLCARVQTLPFRFVSRALGAITLVSLAIGMGGEGSVFYEELGDGGIERWIAYPAVLWLVAFGAYLTARGDEAPDA